MRGLGGPERLEGYQLPPSPGICVLPPGARSPPQRLTSFPREALRRRQCPTSPRPGLSPDPRRPRGHPRSRCSGGPPAFPARPSGNRLWMSGRSERAAFPEPRTGVGVSWLVGGLQADRIGGSRRQGAAAARSRARRSSRTPASCSPGRPPRRPAGGERTSWPQAGKPQLESRSPRSPVPPPPPAPAVGAPWPRLTCEQQTAEQRAQQDPGVPAADHGERDAACSPGARAPRGRPPQPIPSRSAAAAGPAPPALLSAAPARDSHFPR